MAPRALVVVLLALAALGGRADAAVDDTVTAMAEVTDAVPVSEAEFQEEEATDAPTQASASDRYPAGVQAAPPSGDWRADPEVRPPRQ